MKRSKLYHIPFWGLYNYTWWVIGAGNPLGILHDILFTPYAIKFSGYVIFQALAAYFNLYFLIPRYLEKSRFIAYAIYLLFTILSASLLIVLGYYLSAGLSGRTLTSLYGGNSDCFNHFFGNALPSTTAAMTLAMSIKLTVNWIQTKRRQQLLEKEKLETELKFLKNQFNPHFLFNTINSIFFLIHKTPNLASASLAKFSELLRYQLYECNDLQIPLHKEITYIENFIELEKLRQNNNVEVMLELDQHRSGHLGVAPFILMTFVENAFKHVSKHTGKSNWISIRLSLKQRQLDFSVANSASLDATTEVVHYGGIGLKNVQRRLDLLYSGQYDLDIRRTADQFEVRLQMQLSDLIINQTIEKNNLVTV